MKCPWQWRQPFLDEKLESRKRKMGDGYFYDPVDPSFVDHLLPGHAKKLCTDDLEVDEKEKIQQEIERLMLKKEEEHDEFVANAAMIYDSRFLVNEPSAANRSKSTPSTPNSVDGIDDGDASTENQALVDSILLMSKAVADASQASSLLASPLSDSSSSDEEDLDTDVSSCDESAAEEHASDADTMDQDETHFARSPSLELVSDNLQESLMSVDDDDLLNFADASAASSD